VQKKEAALRVYVNDIFLIFISALSTMYTELGHEQN